MDGTILGVLLGITMTVLAACIWYGYKEIPALQKQNASLVQRVEFLEKRKAILTDAATSQPKPAGVAGIRIKRWDENAPYVEKASN